MLEIQYRSRRMSWDKGVCKSIFFWLVCEKYTLFWVKNKNIKACRSSCFSVLRNIFFPVFILWYGLYRGFPGSTSGKEPACQCRKRKRCGFDPWVRKIPWRRPLQPTPVFFPGESPQTEEPRGLQSIGSQSQMWLKWLSTHAHGVYKIRLILTKPLFQLLSINSLIFSNILNSHLKITFRFVYLYSSNS